MGVASETRPNGAHRLQSPPRECLHEASRIRRHHGRSFAFRRRAAPRLGHLGRQSPPRPSLRPGPQPALRFDARRASPKTRASHLLCGLDLSRRPRTRQRRSSHARGLRRQRTFRRHLADGLPRQDSKRQPCTPDSLRAGGAPRYRPSSSLAWRNVGHSRAARAERLCRPAEPIVIRERWTTPSLRSRR